MRCAIGIGRCGSPSDLPTLLDALADQDVKIRGACVEALSLFQGEEATAALVAKMNTPNAETKLAVLQALARRGEKSTMPVFVTAARTPTRRCGWRRLPGWARSAMRPQSRSC